jgi:hypothetical protein
MKRNTIRTTDPLDGEVDFSRFGPVRRNAFAGAGQRGGPSLLALWEMPELAPGAVLLRRGNPGKGKSRKTVVRSVRLPAEIWREVDARARAKHLNVHQAMRAALLGWLERAAEPRIKGRAAGRGRGK